MTDITPVTAAADVVEETPVTTDAESAPIESTSIPFKDVPVEHEGRKYICTKYGLLFEGHSYCFEPAVYLPEPTPIPTIEANPADDEIYFDEEIPAGTPRERAEMPISWWRAQCAFRGFNSTGSIDELMTRLREGEPSNEGVGARMTLELKTIERDRLKELKKKTRKRGAPREPRNFKPRHHESGEQQRYEEHHSGRDSRGHSREVRTGRPPPRNPNKRRRGNSNDVMQRFGAPRNQDTYDYRRGA